MDRQVPVNILVSGAAGKTGRAICAALPAPATAVCGLVRRESQVEPLLKEGVEAVVVGDMLDEKVWQQALAGMDALYLICPNMHPEETAIARLAIAAARRHNLPHLVYHSVLHPQTRAMPHHWQKLAVEEMLFASDLPFTILQPAAYMQNMMAYWGTIQREGIFRAPYPVHTKSSPVDLQDVAQVAAQVLTEPNHEGAIYELAGPEILTQIEISAVLSDHLGQPVTAVAQPLTEWQTQAKEAGLSPYAVTTLQKMFAYYAANGFWGNSRVLHWLLGREPTTLAQFVARWSGGQPDSQIR